MIMMLIQTILPHASALPRCSEGDSRAMRSAFGRSLETCHVIIIIAIGCGQGSNPHCHQTSHSCSRDAASGRAVQLVELSRSTSGGMSRSAVRRPAWAIMVHSGLWTERAFRTSFPFFWCFGGYCKHLMVRANHFRTQSKASRVRVPELGVCEGVCETPFIAPMAGCAKIEHVVRAQPDRLHDLLSASGRVLWPH